MKEERKYSRADVIEIYAARSLLDVMKHNPDYYQDPLTNPGKSAEDVLSIANKYPEFFTKKEMLRLELMVESYKERSRNS